MAPGLSLRSAEPGGNGSADAVEFRRLQALQQSAAEASVQRRRLVVLPSGPTESENSEAVVLHKDFLNVVDASDGVEAEITRDDDRGVRIYVPGTPSVLATEAGDPVRTAGASSTAEATVSSVTLPAGTLGTSGKAILELVGEFVNNSGSSNTYRLRFKLGSTTVYDKSTSIVTSTLPRAFVWRVHISARGATNKQRMTVEVMHGRPLAGTSGYGDWGEFTGYAFTLHGDATEDSTTDLAVAATMTNSVSNANTYTRLYSAKLIAIP